MMFNLDLLNLVAVNIGQPWQLSWRLLGVHDGNDHCYQNNQ